MYVIRIPSLVMSPADPWAGIGRIPTSTSQETRIYPLPHTYVVKDLVPDLTQFYKQYKSIKPYLQRETKTEDVCPAPPLQPPLVNLLPLATTAQTQPR